MKLPSWEAARVVHSHVCQAKESQPYTSILTEECQQGAKSRRSTRFGSHRQLKSFPSFLSGLRYRAMTTPVLLRHFSRAFSHLLASRTQTSTDQPLMHVHRLKQQPQHGGQGQGPRAGAQRCIFRGASRPPRQGAVMRWAALRRTLRSKGYLRNLRPQQCSANFSPGALWQMLAL